MLLIELLGDGRGEVRGDILGLPPICSKRPARSLTRLGELLASPAAPSSGADKILLPSISAFTTRSLDFGTVTRCWCTKSVYVSHAVRISESLTHDLYHSAFDGGFDVPVRFAGWCTWSLIGSRDAKLTGADRCLRRGELVVVVDVDE
jgi:hypothetical protein